MTKLGRLMVKKSLDATLARIAADQIQIGSIVRSERLAKYNRLLRIEAELQRGIPAQSAKPGAMAPSLTASRSASMRFRQMGMGYMISSSICHLLRVSWFTVNWNRGGL